nr:immunoglobulin light chain junction region [Macaca mulatta]MPN91471.1 immunoglobulin light chain junction region [Macaca mulatta]
CQQYNTLPFSF